MYKPSASGDTAILEYKFWIQNSEVTGWQQQLYNLQVVMQLRHVFINFCVMHANIRMWYVNDGENGFAVIMIFLV